MATIARVDAEHARSRHDALIHGLFQLHIGVSCAFGAEVANGGEAGHQGHAQMVYRPGGSQRESFVRHLIVPRSFVVCMQQDVRMALHHSRHQRGAGQIDHGGAGRVNAGRWTRRLNPLALGYDNPAFVHRLAIEHARRLQYHGRSVRVALPATAALCDHRDRHQNKKPKH